MCFLTMERDAANARYDQLHEERPYHTGTFGPSWSDKRTKSHPYHFRDGVEIFVSLVDLNPDDDFLSSSDD